MHFSDVKTGFGSLLLSDLEGDERWFSSCDKALSLEMRHFSPTNPSQIERCVKLYTKRNRRPKLLISAHTQNTNKSFSCAVKSQNKVTVDLFNTHTPWSGIKKRLRPRQRTFLGSYARPQNLSLLCWAPFNHGNSDDFPRVSLERCNSRGALYHAHTGCTINDRSAVVHSQNLKGVFITF